MRAGRHPRDRGATIPIVALLLPILVLMTAFAVDLGRQRSDRRSMQAVADVVALDMIRVVDGRILDLFYDDPATIDALEASAARNGAIVDLSDVVSGPQPRITALEWGLLDATNAFVPLDPFDPLKPLDLVTVPTAVRITAEDTTDYSFQPGAGDVTRQAVALGEDVRQAYWQVGSFLASVTPASNTVIGSVLSPIFPGAEVLSYNGLVGANVTLAGLAAGLNAVSPGAGLDSTVSYETLALATASALQAQGGNAAAITILQGLATLAGSGTVSVGQLVGIDASGGSPAGTATYDVLGLLTGAAFIADGDHAIAIPGSEVNIPAVGSVDVALEVIERPQIGGPNLFDTASTGQFDLALTPQFSVSTAPSPLNVCTLSNAVKTALQDLVGGVLGLAGCLLGPVFRNISLQVSFDGPISLRAAGADTQLTDIDCEGIPPSITVTPQPIPLALTSNVEMIITGTLNGASLGDLARITLDQSALAIGTASPEAFQHPTEFGPPPRRIGSNPLGLAGLLTAAPADVTLLNVPLGPVTNPLVVPILDEVNDVVGQIDTLLLPPIANALGLSLGGADLTALSMFCDRSVPSLAG